MEQSLGERGDGFGRAQGVEPMTDKAKILVIDDDHDFVDATCLVLESESYAVAVAYDGDEGLAKARAEKPDLIILDIIRICITSAGSSEV